MYMYIDKKRSKTKRPKINLNPLKINMNIFNTYYEDNMVVPQDILGQLKYASDRNIKLVAYAYPMLGQPNRGTLEYQNI